MSNQKDEKIGATVEGIRAYFHSGATLSYEWRKAQLLALRNLFTENLKMIHAAVAHDLGKCEFDSLLTEVDPVVAAIDEMVHELPSFMEDEPRDTNVPVMPAKSYVHYEPLGVVLIIGPYNYPLHLVTMPLVGAIGAGNCAVIKPTSACPEVSHVIARLIPKYMDTRAFAVFEGSVALATQLLDMKFDHIFFTGSVDTGKVVMKAAAQHLTPVTLELGGKSPVIVAEDADLDLTARRLLWGKCLNVGQTCVAPDYVFVHRSIKQGLLQSMEKYLTQAYGTFKGSEMKQAKEYARIVSEKHTARLKSYLDEHPKGSILIGGDVDVESKFVAPTVVDESKCTLHGKCKLMNEEIFGPILPILEYDDVKECIQYITSRPKPLAMYVFTLDNALFRRILEATTSGQCMLNDTIVHLGNPFLPFGGVGSSGMGRYHGKDNFYTFSHHRSVVEKSRYLDLPQRYPPYESSPSKQTVLHIAQNTHVLTQGRLIKAGWMVLGVVLALVAYRLRHMFGF